MIDDTRRETPVLKLPIHPAADTMPMMSDDNLRELADDIRANGLLHPIVIWEDNREAVNGSTGPFQRFILDGRNRIAACKLLGTGNPLDQTRDISRVRLVHAVMQGGATPDGWIEDVDPTVYVMSANVKRRHLTPEQKRERIDAYIAANPTANDSRVAKATNTSDKTVAKRRKETGQNSDDPKNDQHVAMGRALKVVRENPGLSQAAQAKLAEVSVGTIKKVRALMAPDWQEKAGAAAGSKPPSTNGKAVAKTAEEKVAAKTGAMVLGLAETLAADIRKMVTALDALRERERALRAEDRNLNPGYRVTDEIDALISDPITDLMNAVSLWNGGY